MPLAFQEPGGGGGGAEAPPPQRERAGRRPGAKTMVEMEAGAKCGRCRREFREGDLFCSGCGEQRAVGAIQQLSEDEAEQTDDEEGPSRRGATGQRGPQRGASRRGSTQVDGSCEEADDRVDRERALLAENQELIEALGALERTCAELRRQQRARGPEPGPGAPAAEAEARARGAGGPGAEGRAPAGAGGPGLLRVQGIFRSVLHRHRLRERDEAVQQLQRELDRVQGKYQHAKDEVSALQARERDQARRAREKDAELRGALGALDEAKETLRSERSICAQKTAEVGRLSEEMESLLAEGRADDRSRAGRSGTWHEGRSSIGTCRSLAAELEGLDLSPGASEAGAEGDELAHARASLAQAEAEAAGLRARQQQLLAELAAAGRPGAGGAAQGEELRARAAGGGADAAELERLSQELSRRAAEAEAQAADGERLRRELSRATAEAERSRAHQEELQQEVSRLRAEAEESAARVALLEAEVSEREGPRARASALEAEAAEKGRLQQEISGLAAVSSRLAAAAEESCARAAALEAEEVPEKQRPQHGPNRSAAEGADPPADDEPEIIGTRWQELQELRRDVERLAEELAASRAREQQAVDSAEGLRRELAARGAGGGQGQGRAREHQELLGRVVELQRELALAKKQAHEWKLQASQPWYERIVSFSSCVSKKPEDVARAAPRPDSALAGAAGEGPAPGGAAGQEAGPPAGGAGQPALMLQEDRL